MQFFGRDTSCISVVYDQSFCKKDPEGENKWDTIRDMTRIWTTKSHSEKNTILVDNETRKVKECPRNAIIVTQYEAKEVEKKVAGSLNLLEAYLTTMALSSEFGNDDFDVRVYMEEHPFNEEDKQKEETQKDSKGKDKDKDEDEMMAILEKSMKNIMVFDSLRGETITYQSEEGNIKVEGQVSKEKKEEIITKKMQLGNLRESLRQMNSPNSEPKIYINGKLLHLNDNNNNGNIVEHSDTNNN